MGLLVSIDTGGTLTDVCAFDGARAYHAKTLTTPHDLSECLMDGLEALAELVHGPDQLDELIAQIDHIRYSTTQGTNAVVQRKGPRLGLICENADQLRTIGAANPDLFEQLVGERTVISSKNDEDRALVAATSDLVASGANRIVIAFSGLDAAQREQAAKRALYRAFPRHLLGAAPLLFAHELAGRGSDCVVAWTALLNAFLHPSMEQFLYNAEEKLRRRRNRNPLLIFGNDGRSHRVAKTIALNTYSSGPRGGVAGVEALCAHHNIKRAVSIDVGGTTTDIAFVRDGMIDEDLHGRIENVEIAFPLARVDSVGAGGSSILRAAAGEISIGPDSVGSAPGPACFARGGENATITDALAVSGLFNPETFFGGRLKLDITRAQTAISRNIAEPLGLSLADATLRAIDAYEHKIASALTHRQKDVRDLWLIAFGGAGPMNACGIAEKAGVAHVLAPRQAAVFSAFGIGFSDVRHVYGAPLHAGADIEALKSSLLDQARRGMYAEGFTFEECKCAFNVIVGDGDKLERRALAASAKAPPSADWLELEAVRPMPKPAIAAEGKPRASKPKPASTRKGFQQLPVYQLETLAPGAEGEGPCLVEEAYFTTWVKAGWRFRIGAAGDIFLSRR
jgi:N-methylhydantoinase A/oxoprolinase/acetone carboxylase beta subunit